jgi:hypothetical protein
MTTFRTGLLTCAFFGLLLNACSSDTSSGNGKDAGSDGQAPGSGGSGNASGGKSGSGGSSAGTGGSKAAGGTTTGGDGGKAGASTGGKSGTQTDGGGGSSGKGTPDAGTDAATGIDAGGDASLEPAVTGVGDPVIGVPNASASIGAAGGTLVSGDGQITLTIPAGALTTNTTIGIQTIANTAPLAAGFAYRFTPDGTTFAKPVTVTMKPTLGQIGGSSLDHVKLAFQDAQHRWQLIPVTADDTAKTVTATTTHFTDYAFLFDLALSGNDAVFAGTGTELHVVELHTASGMAATVGPAQTGLPTWQLDGTPTGNGSDGELDPLANAAAYTAPSKIPSTNPVSVSVSYTASNGAKITLVQDIHILAHKYRYTTTLVDDPTCTGGSGYSFNYSTSASIDLNLDASFDITSSNPSAAVTPTISAVAVCPPANAACSASAEPSKTTGLTLTTVTGAWEPAIHRLRIQPRGTGSSSPSYLVDCGQAGSHEVVAGNNAWNIPGYADYMEGKDGEMVSAVQTLASGQAGPKFALAVVTP